MDKSSLTVFAEFHAKPGSEQALGELLKGLIEPTRKEQGCLRYDLHVDNDKPGHFLFFEDWVSMALLQAHLGSPHLTALQSQSAGLVAEPPRIVFASRIG
jgi:quinol monooxygenase YgiN